MIESLQEHHDTLLFHDPFATVLFKPEVHGWGSGFRNFTIRGDRSRFTAESRYTYALDKTSVVSVRRFMQGTRVVDNLVFINIDVVEFGVMKVYHQEQN